MAWLANALAVYALYAVGSHYRHGFLVGAVGCVLWTLEGVFLAHPALIFIEVILGVLYLRGWFAWKAHVPAKPEPDIRRGGTSVLATKRPRLPFGLRYADDEIIIPPVRREVDRGSGRGSGWRIFGIGSNQMEGEA